MKQKLRLLSTLLLLAVASMAWADSTVTIDFENNALPTGWVNTNEMIVVSNPVSNTSSTNGLYCLSTNGKASNSLTSGYIENIVSISVDATRTSNNTTNEVYIDFCPNTSFGSSDTQTQSVTVNKNSWSTSTLTLSSKASGYVRIRRSGGSSTATKFIDNIVITCESGGIQTVAKPSISGDESFVTSTQVSISCNTDGATITYSTDDGNTWTNYDSPFTLTATTTVQAKATKSGMTDSEVASKTFTKVTALDNLAALASKAKGYTGYVTLTNALVTYKTGNNAYIEDASAGMYLYGCAGDLAAGDKITGIMNVTSFDVYSNLPEVKGFTLVDGYTKTSGNTVTPAVVTIAELNANFTDYISRYIKIENATVTSAFSDRNCTIEQNGASIVLRDQNKPGELSTIEGSQINVIGHGMIYGESKQIALYVQGQIEVISSQPVDPDVSFASETMSVEVGGTATNPITKPADLIVSYSSGKEAIATVDENGEVTGVAEGNTTITATWAAVENKYYAGSVSYALTVTAPAVTYDVIDLRGKTEAITFSSLNSFVQGSGYNDYSSVSLAGNDGNIYIGWSANQVMSGNGLQMAKNSGQLVSPTVKSDNGVKIDVQVETNSVSIVMGEQSSTDGSLTSSETENTFTVKAGSSYAQISSITITPLTEKPKANPGLDYATKTINKTVGDENFTNELINPNNLAVTYNSSEPSVATVNNNGEVTIVGEGTTIITAAFSGNDDYLEGEASYTLVVSNAPSGEEAVFKKVTSTDDITDGEYLIVYEEGSLAFDGSLATLDAVSNTIGVVIDNGSIEASTANAFTLSSTTGEYSIKSASGNYIGQTSDANGIATSTSDAYANTIEIDNDGNVNIVSGGAYLRYNSASNQLRFRYYKSSTYEAQKAIQLYKKVSATPQPETITVTISDKAKGNDNYYYGTLYYGEYNLVVPEGIVAYTYTVENGKMKENHSYEAEDVIPAGTGVLLKTQTATEYQFTVTTDPGVEDDDNYLFGSDIDAQTNAGEGDWKYYKLITKGGKDLGFYFGVDGGAPFTNGAHKAYLAVPAGQAPAKGFVLGEETTGINAIDNSQQAVESIYNLSGQRVQKATKGVYIVNGKKVVIR